MEEKVSLGRRILKMNFAQWVAAIGLILTIGGYIVHGEQEHEVTIIERDRSIHQRDSIIIQMGLHYNEFLEFRKTYYDNQRTMRDKETQLDLRMDNMETRETKTETWKEDFLYWYKPKNK